MYAALSTCAVRLDLDDYWYSAWAHPIVATKARGIKVPEVVHFRGLVWLDLSKMLFFQEISSVRFRVAILVQLWQFQCVLYFHENCMVCDTQQYFAKMQQPHYCGESLGLVRRQVYWIVYHLQRNFGQRRSGNFRK